MNRFANLLPAVALALTVPAWAVAPSEDTKQDATKAASQQVDATSSSQEQNPGTAVKRKGHGPTAVMDRATPTEKSTSSGSSAKHPPTARMDRSTPNQKSSASDATGDTETNAAQGASPAK